MEMRERIARALEPVLFGDDKDAAHRRARPLRVDVAQASYLSEADAIIARLYLDGYVIVPKEPTEGLLVSMALRRDHAFGLGPASEQENILEEMRGLYEEIVGLGFYRPERESDYRAMLESRP